jgi:uncharacterized protein (TIGR02266 family)
VRARTDVRSEVYGVLIAEAHEYWRARILTYPNMLWSVPAGRGTIKFVGRSAQEVEVKALDYIRDHCRARGLKIEEVLDPVETDELDAESAAIQAPRQAKEVRLQRSLPVRFGVEKATERARTSDLSGGGLFVQTDKPLPRGVELKLLLKLDSFTIPLTGKVAWVRIQDEPGRPRGMGVQLHDPPSMYGRHVRALAEAGKGSAGRAVARDEGEDPTPQT